MRSIALNLPKELLDDTSRCARQLRITRADYIRMAIHKMNRRMAAQARAERLGELSRRVREESMRVNGQFAAIERDPDA